MHSLGFREFLLADDIFTSDQKWAGEVAEAITATGTNMLWTCQNGIRVESADAALFQKMRRAGCYRVSFGFESGNDEVLKQFGKGGRATVEQGRKAVQMARQAGIETSGFFLLGLSSDTVETMEETVDFARTVPVDMLKFGSTIAFPGTPMFKDYHQAGLIRSYDWDDYHIYTEEPLFSHPNIPYETVVKMMDLAYKKAITRNPGFIWRRFQRGIRTGEIFWDAWYFLRFLFMPATSEKQPVDYYAGHRWPTVDYDSAKELHLSDYQIVRKTPASEVPAIATSS